MDRPAERLADRLATARAHRQERRRHRRRRALEPLPGMRVRAAGKVLHNFSSNDYLGLAGEPFPGAATGSGASALVTGYQPAHEALERALAAFLDREAVLLTSSGYLANFAALTALAGRGDTIVQDRLCHASLVDAAKLSGAGLRRYPHADPAAAARQLEAAGGHRLLVTDGVFSMDGDFAPVAELAALARREGATLVVDDAHGIGVLGATGRGLCEGSGLDAGDVPVLIGTLGKAFGVAGAFIAGSRSLVEHLENHARSIIYSTALPPAMAEAGLAALERLSTGSDLRERLSERIDQLRRGAAERGIDLLPSETPIQPLVIGAEEDALALSAALEERGYLVTAIRPPTVPVGTSRLRITLSAAHAPEQVIGLLDALAGALADLAESAPERATDPSHDGDPPVGREPGP
ncbi:MAG: 8-amino-7-oxononanoate synthase [Xanthomonadales bacterium]|nr:8-amino-7-oxononanoate synthase [Xanthomonadales bacterium]